MTRILVLGMSPLPFEDEPKIFGPGFRTWQFVKPLLADGHEVCLCCCRIFGTYRKESVSKSVCKVEDRNLTYYHMDQATFEKQSFLQQIHDDFGPDCIVGATAYPSSRAVLLRAEKPVWADMFGDLMSEAQAKAYVYDNDHYLFHFWAMNRPLIENADIFSSVSVRQKYALIGQLAAVGRLNKHSFGYDFVHVIPCGIDDAKLSREKRVLRGKHVNQKDFVILWNGGFNTWTDVRTLFLGLEAAMKEDKRIRFVCAGAEIPGHDEKTYASFTKMIEKSTCRERFLLLGWVPPKEIHNYYFEADLAINIDKFCYEAIFGSRNRVLGWMQAGLAVLTTPITELTETLEREGIITTFLPGDSKGLERAILKLARNRRLLSRLGQAGKEFVFNHYTYERTVVPLRDWVKSPARSPDHGMRIPFEAYMRQPVKRSLVGTFFECVKTDGFLSATNKALRWLFSKFHSQ